MSKQHEIDARKAQLIDSYGPDGLAQMVINSEEVWEKTMMAAIGEDGPKSVAEAIRKLQVDLEKERRSRRQAQEQLSQYQQEQKAAGLCIDAALRGEMRPSSRWWDGRMEKVRDMAVERDALAARVGHYFWKDNASHPITDQHIGEVFLIKLKSEHDGITHTDESGTDFTIDITWIRSESGAVATTGTYSNDEILSWVEIPSQTPSSALARVKAEAVREAFNNPTVTSAMKADLIGGFSFVIEGGNVCPNCWHDGTQNDDCEICHGASEEGGVSDLSVTVPWDVQKDIFKAMCRHYAQRLIDEAGE